MAPLSAPTHSDAAALPTAQKTAAYRCLQGISRRVWDWTVVNLNRIERAVRLRIADEAVLIRHAVISVMRHINGGQSHRVLHAKRFDDLNGRLALVERIEVQAVRF